jgi:hypothetical protein
VRPWTPEELTRARDLVCSGLSHAEAARLLGRSRPALSCALCKHRLTDPTPDASARREQLRRLHARGLTRPQMALQLRCSVSTVDADLRLLGLRQPAANRRIGIRAALREEGLPSLVALRYRRERLRALREGLPNLRSAREARLVKRLASFGPDWHCAREWASLLGRAHGPRHRTLTRQLASLARRRVLARRNRPGAANLYEYRVSPELVARLNRDEAC